MNRSPRGIRNKELEQIFKVTEENKYLHLGLVFLNSPLTCSKPGEVFAAKHKTYSITTKRIGKVCLKINAIAAHYLNMKKYNYELLGILYKA
jgi:hypothetical protein